ncbi:AHH domain-containing protein [Simiduia agarivorans]|uniref:Uncharacterized protein n=1 Tax=Simiduia agarivorans (strain DSM 21679 / JCM 13881 / BCRC 17597 / SA1) TaxID=1117647 RepID=K4KH34_SIMAS|nr:AHH domain-containing protein [Simiduia agarivorans]AFU98419.2 hypothetical protein M5M_06120 [Simiduia agarivorans SA1 = DSM 21679]
MQIEYQAVDELDFRLGLIELLSAYGKIDQKTNSLINRVVAETKLRAMQDALKLYVEEGQRMTQCELMQEKHSSGRIGGHMETSGYDKPADHFHAHAIVSGGHKRAYAAREILAQFNIRIDEPANGLWLPNYKKNLHLSPIFDCAHGNIHNKIYYLNITACLEQAMSQQHAREILRRVAQGIVSGRLPIHRQLRAREIMEFANG